MDLKPRNDGNWIQLLLSGLARKQVFSNIFPQYFSFQLWFKYCFYGFTDGYFYFMKKNIPGLDAQEQLKAENDFMKMKLMLENGAEFSNDNVNDPVPAEIENQFLKNIIEFESQFARHKTIKVFDRIGKPFHFREPAAISDGEIEEAWLELSAYLQEHGIMLDVCSPNVGARELYRFTIEELFEYEMEDIRVPGMMHGFIYDEFHPDVIYDNTEKAVNYCIRMIFSKTLVDPKYLPFFKSSNLRLNEHYPLTTGKFTEMINRFKSVHDELEVLELIESGCTKTETAMVVSGRYMLHAETGSEKFPLAGSWQVDFELEAASGEWMIHRVQIENIKF